MTATRIKAPPRRAGLVAMAAVLAVLVGCGEPDPPEDLARAAHVIRYMTSARHINRSGYVAVSERKPSTWVSYLFSDIGAAEWPASEEWADEMERQQMASIGAPIVPAGVNYSPGRVNPASGRQIVVRADDARGVIVVEGYVGPDAAPVLVEELTLPPAR